MSIGIALAHAMQSKRIKGWITVELPSQWHEILQQGHGYAQTVMVALR